MSSLPAKYKRFESIATEKTLRHRILEAHGQLTPKSVAGSGPNSNSSKLIHVYISLPASIKGSDKKQLKVVETPFYPL